MTPRVGSGTGGPAIDPERLAWLEPRLCGLLGTRVRGSDRKRPEILCRRLRKCRAEPPGSMQVRPIHAQRLCKDGGLTHAAALQSPPARRGGPADDPGGGCPHEAAGDRPEGP